MNRRSRSSPSPTRPDSFQKYLKPGALAQIRDSRIRIRDSRISARTHRVNALPISMIASSPSSNTQPSTVTVSEGFPCFAGRIYGPCCPQRKKLMATKSVLFLNPNPVSDSSDPVVDLFNSDILVAH